MDRRSLIFSVVLAASISFVPSTAQQTAGQPKNTKPSQNESSIDKTKPSPHENDKAKKDNTASKNPPPANTQPATSTPQPQPNPSDENIEIQRKLAEYSARLADYTKYLVWIGGAVGFLQVVLMFLQAPIPRRQPMPPRSVLTF